MFLRRNPFTILFSIIFAILLGIGFFEVMYLAISSSKDRNVIACIIILGIIIYLIVAFLLKESRKVQFFQKDPLLLKIVELVLVFLILAGSVFLNIDSEPDQIISVLALLLLIYGCSRLLGGRICGMAAISFGFFFFQYLAMADYKPDDSLDFFCFLVPYFAFLLVTKKLTALYMEQSFLIVTMYILLAVVFSLAIILNPLTAALLAGCFLSLLFGKMEPKGKIINSGPCSALILLGVSALIVVCVYVFMPDLSIELPLDLDLRIRQLGIDYVDIGEYLFNKYLQSSELLFQTSQTGVFPSLLFFFAALSGYYAVRKKASAVTPLCIAYVGVLVYHLLFLGLSKEFYYVFYFLPVFSAYGIYNTLISENIEDVTEKGEQEEQQREREQEEEEGEGEEQQEKQQELSPAEPIPTPLQTTEQESENLRKEIKKEKEKKKQIRQKRNRRDEKHMAEPANVMEAPLFPADDLPEWTAPAGFTVNRHIQDESPVRDSIVLPEPDDTVMPTETTVLNESAILAEPAQREEPIPDTSADLSGPSINVDISLAENAEFTDMSEGFEMVQEEEPLFTDTDDLVVNHTEDISYEDSNVLLSVDNLSSEHNIAGESGDIVSGTEMDNDADAQLSSLLNRLDISDNIRRMNESAREDIADIIERDDTIRELHQAKPADEIDFDTSEIETKQPLPKYVKPEFDFTMEPLTQPLNDTGNNISEYDKVPTINDLEKKWRDLNEPAQEIEPTQEETTTSQYSFAYSLDDVKDVVMTTDELPRPATTPEIHSEEVVKKTGAGERSYHKLTIG